MRGNIDIFDFELTENELGHASPPSHTGESLFFDQRDPAQVSRLERRASTMADNDTPTPAARPETRAARSHRNNRKTEEEQPNEHDRPRRQAVNPDQLAAASNRRFADGTARVMHEQCLGLR
jgi:hypothetical protein